MTEIIAVIYSMTVYEVVAIHFSVVEVVGGGDVVLLVDPFVYLIRVILHLSTIRAHHFHIIFGLFEAKYMVRDIIYFTF